MAQQLTTHLGILEPFDGSDFVDYSERLNSYFIANNIGQVAEDAGAADGLQTKRKLRLRSQ